MKSSSRAAIAVIVFIAACANPNNRFANATSSPRSAFISHVVSYVAPRRQVEGSSIHGAPLEEGERQGTRTTGWKSMDPNDLAGGARYQFFISSVVPRPVAVITTRSPSSSAEEEGGTGTVNCAPFSYTSLSSHDPPIVTHGICMMSGGRKKDTLKNIEATGEWVFHTLTTTYLDEANACAATIPSEVDETQQVGLETLPCEVVSVPRLAQAAVAMECKLYKKEEIFNDNGDHTTTIVMGRVVKVHVHESVLKEGQPDDNPLIDLDKLQAVGRAGDVTYWPVGVLKENTLPMPRPK